MKEAAYLRFLYRTVPGRVILKALVWPPLSRAVGRFLDSPASKALIGPFMRKEGISPDSFETPSGGFKSFNQFFSRNCPGVCFDMEPGHLCSPCDGRLSAVKIRSDGKFYIKHTAYSLKVLLGSESLAEKFCGGTAFIFRLMPRDYHRYRFIDSGETVSQRKIPGILHCVRPIALENFPVFVQNSRDVALLKTENFGDVIQIEVGAMLVGKICNHRKPKFSRGEEKGYFEYGGSTVILMFRKGIISLNPGIRRALKCKEEKFVYCGEFIAANQEEAV